MVCHDTCSDDTALICGDTHAGYMPKRAAQRACFPHALSWSWPQLDKLSMCVSSSSQVITPGVGSGATKFGQAAHFGYAPTSLHMSSQRPASFFCNCARCFKSSVAHACSPCPFFTWSMADGDSNIARKITHRMAVDVAPVLYCPTLILDR